MEIDLTSLAQQFSKEFRDIEEPSEVKLLRDNQKGWTIEFNNFIFKLAKQDKVQETQVRIRDVLLDQQGEIGNLQIPYPKYFYTSGDIPYSAIGYRKVPGSTPTPSIIEDSREFYAEKLASFLSELHHNTPRIQNDLGMTLFPPTIMELDDKFSNLEKVLSQYFSQEEITGIQRFQADLKKYLRSYLYDPVPIHGDCWYGNHLVEPTTGDLIGILDFDNMSLGDPLVDVVVQNYVSEEFMDRVFHHYSRLQSHLDTIDIHQHAYFILGLRELLSLIKQDETGRIDPDTPSKIRKQILAGEE